MPISRASTPIIQQLDLTLCSGNTLRLWSWPLSQSTAGVPVGIYMSWGQTLASDCPVVEGWQMPLLPWGVSQRHLSGLTRHLCLAHFSSKSKFPTPLFIFPGNSSHDVTGTWILFSGGTSGSPTPNQQTSTEWWNAGIPTISCHFNSTS